MLSTVDRASWREEYGGRWGVDLGLLALLLAMASAAAPLADPDLPMHLAIGEWIVRHGTVPTVEPFAWTRAGDPYYAYSWLPQVVFYWSYEAAGVTGLRLLQGLASLAIIASIFVLARFARWSIWTAIVLTGMQALVAMIFARHLRPHVVLIAAVPLAWGVSLRLLDSNRPWKWAIALFVLSAVAANSHFLFPVLAAPWLLLLLRWPGIRKAAWMVGATAAGWLATPYLLHWPSVIALNLGENALLRFPTPIIEFAPGVYAAVSDPGVLLALAMVLAFLPWMAGSLTARERLVWGSVWLAGFFAFAIAVRAMMFWWLLLLPLLAGTVERVARVPRGRGIVLAQRIAVVLLGLLLVLGRVLNHNADLARDTGAPRWLPTRIAFTSDPLSRWLDCRVRDDAGGRAFTTFVLGSYLNWHYPTLSYSIDTRTIFPDSVAAAESYIFRPPPQAPLGPWRSADLAVVPHRYPVASVLDTASGWRRVAVSGHADPAVDSVGLFVTERWWQSVSDSVLPDSAVRLPAGRAGVQAACG